MTARKISTGNIAGLKLLVFSMGLVLIGGTLLLAAVVWRKAVADAPPDTGSALHAAGCPGGRVNLKGRGMVVDSAVQGKTLRVTLARQEGKREIVTIDLCTGALLGALAIDADADMDVQ